MTENILFTSLSATPSWKVGVFSSRSIPMHPLLADLQSFLLLLPLPFSHSCSTFIALWLPLLFAVTLLNERIASRELSARAHLEGIKYTLRRVSKRSCKRRCKPSNVDCISNRARGTQRFVRIFRDAQTENRKESKKSKERREPFFDKYDIGMSSLSLIAKSFT